MPSRKLNFGKASGPVDKVIYGKFKRGALSLPEPYNTIIHSIRCIPAKLTED
jgi:hypothetical protein